MRANGIAFCGGQRNLRKLPPLEPNQADIGGAHLSAIELEAQRTLTGLLGRPDEVITVQAEWRVWDDMARSCGEDEGRAAPIDFLANPSRRSTVGIEVLEGER